MMDRRVFMSGFTLGLLAAPLGAEAQQVGKVYRIGVVAPGVNPRSASFFQAFEQRLRELGWVDGRNLVIDFQMPKGSSDISSIAADLVGQNVDLILAGGPEASLKAARQATSTIPIVMVALNYDPVERGHVASLAHPGRNVTGVFSLAPEQGAKQLELLRDQAKIAELAVRHPLSAGGFVSGVAGGLLLGYGVPASVPYRRAADYVDTIFLSSSLASSSSSSTSRPRKRWA
jgi:ABC-type uncharacterized transport system substrate-binding protein